MTVDTRLFVRVSFEDKRAWERFAFSNGYDSLSQFIRFCVEREITRSAFTLVGNPSEAGEQPELSKQTGQGQEAPAESAMSEGSTPSPVIDLPDAFRS